MKPRKAIESDQHLVGGVIVSNALRWIVDLGGRQVVAVALLHNPRITGRQKLGQVHEVEHVAL
jgi:hypothetical protein